MRPATCRRSGRRTRRRNGCAGWWRAATRSCAIGPGSRTRCIRSRVPTRSRSARTPIASTGPVEPREVLAEPVELAGLDRAIAESAIEDTNIDRLLTITGVSLTVAAG